MFGLKHAGNRDVCGETATVVSLPVQSGPTLDVDGVLAYIARIAKGAFRGTMERRKCKLSPGLSLPIYNSFEKTAKNVHKCKPLG